MKTTDDKLFRKMLVNMIIPAKDTVRVLGLAENQNNTDTTVLDRLVEEIS
jgi:hypothetical protein